MIAIEWEGFVTTRAFWTAVLVFRLWNALFVRTAFNPDEYWQSTEVAHRMVFGYGHLYVLALCVTCVALRCARSHSLTFTCLAYSLAL